MIKKGQHLSPETEFRKGRAKQEPVVMKCKQCGKEIQVLPHEVKHRIYCSRSCRAKKNANRRGKLTPDDKKYWNTEREKVLLENWNRTAKKDVLNLFPNKTWAAIKNQIRYMRVRKGYKIPIRPRKDSAIFLWIHEKEICNLYINENKGSHELAKMFSTKHYAILRLLKKNGVKSRSNSEAQMLSMTEERRKNQSEKIKNIFKEHPQRSEIFTERMREFHKKNPEFRSKKMKDWLSDAENYKKFCATMKLKSNTPEAKERQRNFRMTQVFPLQDAKTTEIPMQNELNKREIKFKKHYLLRNIEGRIIRQGDIAFPEVKLVVECDGDYWHGNPKVFGILNPMQIERKERDKKQDDEISKTGWKVLRFWESDIQDDVSHCVDKIEGNIESR